MHLDEAEFERGRIAGNAEIAAGAPKLYWQTRGSWGELLCRLMRERFGVTVIHTSDMCTSQQDAYWQGYNEVTTAWVDSQFGEGAFQVVRDEVEEYRRESYRLYLANHPTSEDSKS